MADRELFQPEVGDLRRDPPPLPQVATACLVIEQQQGIAFGLFSDDRPAIGPKCHIQEVEGFERLRSLHEGRGTFHQTVGTTCKFGESRCNAFGRMRA